MSIKQAFDNFAFDVIEGAKKNLRDKNASKTLSNSLDYDLSISNKKDLYKLSFLMEDYGEFIDRGVKGKGGTKADGTQWKKKKVSENSLWKQSKGFDKKRPPTRVFDKWIVRRGISPRNKKGQFVSREGLKYAIATSVYHTGIEATEFFTKAFRRELKLFPDELADKVGDELILKLKL